MQHLPATSTAPVLAALRETYVNINSDKAIV